MELFIGATLTSVILILVGVITMKYPPKKINHFYGYRTRRSMSNQVIWDYANALAAKMILTLGFVLLIIGIISYLITPMKSPVISLFALLIGIGVGMYWCETQLNKHFDKNGNRKAKP